MGNRPDRSTETVALLVTEAVSAAWARGGVASLLQLDIKGAFDTVRHDKLLEVLRKKGLPEWLVDFVCSFLTARTARLRFDGAETQRIPITAGTPQGSPLSPLLFILYISTLYDRLRGEAGVVTIGYADDTNLLSVGKTTGHTVTQLRRAWATCEEWADEYGMQFEPAKSELMHFTRAHAADSTRLRIGSATVQPVQSARFLGIWLDRKLRWKEHTRRVKAKIERQNRALYGIAASTWGCSQNRAREIYTKVIRSVIAYGAAVVHSVTPPGGNPSGYAREVATAQSACLRTVSGAFKMTPIHQLEAETACPPIDLYLNARATETMRRAETNGTIRLAQKVVAKVDRKLWTVRHTRRDMFVEARKATAWTCHGTAAETQETKPRLWDEWRLRWQAKQAAVRRSNERYAADDEPDFRHGLRATFRRHGSTPKFVSTMLTQLRTGKIGLNAFLHVRNVPDVANPQCACGEGRDERFFHGWKDEDKGRQRVTASLGRNPSSAAYSALPCPQPPPASGQRPRSRLPPA